MNKTIGIILAVIIIIGGAYLIARNPSEDAGPNQNLAGEGRIVFSLTDAAVNMDTISEITMTVNKVDVHSAAGGWTTVSTSPKSFNLLELNASGESKLVADVDTRVGNYDQVRLDIGTVVVKPKAGEAEEAEMPGSQVVINTNLVVKEDTTSSVNFDFLADQSLHVATNGDYIFAPVVKTETRSEANVTIGANSVVTIGGGTVGSSNTFGMDVDGSLKLDFSLENDERLDIDTNGVINIEGILQK